jgi:hypothetical protein
MPAPMKFKVLPNTLVVVRKLDKVEDTPFAIMFPYSDNPESRKWNRLSTEQWEMTWNSIRRFDPIPLNNPAKAFMEALPKEGEEVRDGYQGTYKMGDAEVEIYAHCPDRHEVKGVTGGRIILDKESSNMEVLDAEAGMQIGRIIGIDPAIPGSESMTMIITDPDHIVRVKDLGASGFDERHPELKDYVPPA